MSFELASESHGHTSFQPMSALTFPLLLPPPGGPSIPPNNNQHIAATAYLLASPVTLMGLCLFYSER